MLRRTNQRGITAQSQDPVGRGTVEDQTISFAGASDDQVHVSGNGWSYQLSGFGAQEDPIKFENGVKVEVTYNGSWHFEPTNIPDECVATDGNSQLTVTCENKLGDYEFDYGYRTD